MSDPAAVEAAALDMHDYARHERLVEGDPPGPVFDELGDAERRLLMTAAGWHLKALREIAHEVRCLGAAPGQERPVQAWVRECAARTVEGRTPPRWVEPEP